MLPFIYTMRNRNLFRKVGVLLLAIAAFCFAASAQKLPEPRQEKLLNGLKLLMWPDPKADKVWVKIRVHSGSAFDPQGKEGVMKLLADSFFPNESTRDFFTQDLGGRLEIVSNYDYIQVDASSKPDEFLTMLETLATAVSNPTIDKETTAKLRTALLARVTALEADPAYVADQAVAKRLFGTFPYGRPQLGTTASVQRIDFADLLDAKQRFLTADNATVAISGNFDRALAFRGVRRFFGSWLKADKTIPSTFRQPDEPEVTVMSLPAPKPGGAAARFAIRGAARNDKDLAASLVFTTILQTRLRSRANEAKVMNQYQTLPGSVMITIPASLTGPRDFILKSVADPITTAEFQAGKSAAQTEWSLRDPVELWHDADTYKIANVDADARMIDSVTLSDVNNYAQKARNLPLVSIVISAQPN
jgi:zinc protease